MTSNNEIMPFNEIELYANTAIESHMFPDIKSKAQAIIKIQTGIEFGLPPIQSLNSFDIIEISGVATIAFRATFLAGRVKSSNKYDYIIIESTERCCKIRFFEKFNENNQELGISSFSIEDANRAQLSGKEIWKKYPKKMLFNRALSQGVKMFCPDLFYGDFYTEDEIENFATPKSEIGISKNNLDIARNAMKEARVSKKENITEYSIIDDVKNRREPLTALKLRDKLRQKSDLIKAQIGENEINENNRKYVNIALNKIFSNSETYRKLFIKFIFNKDSSADLYNNEAEAILAWCRYPNIYNPDWQPEAVILTEFNNLLDYWLLEGIADEN